MASPFVLQDGGKSERRVATSLITPSRYMSEISQLSPLRRIMQSTFTGSPLALMIWLRTITPDGAGCSPVPAGRKPSAPSLGERVLALATGRTRQELYLACPNDRPNHIGVVVQRHLRAGRMQERDGKLYAISPAT